MILPGILRSQIFEYIYTVFGFLILSVSCEQYSNSNFTCEFRQHRGIDVGCNDTESSEKRKTTLKKTKKAKIIKRENNTWRQFFRSDQQL